MDTALNRAVRKAGWRFMPLLLTGYVLNYMDRNSIGFAGLTMNHDLGMSASQFGLAAGIFFISYCLCEVPSNVIQYKIGARLWLSRIMITWGLASAATAFVIGPKSFYAARFILGIAEAGFFPGVAYFVAAWFPHKQRTRIYGWLLLGIPLSSVIGGPICSLLLQMDGILGFAGWKWMFVLVSLPCTLLGFVALKVLRDSPAQATFLTDEERTALQAELAVEEKQRDKMSLWQTLKDKRILILAATHFGFTLGSYAITIWLPQIIKEFHLTNLQVGFTSSVPYIFASLVMLVWTWRVDRKGHTIPNIVVGCALAAAGLWWAVVSTHSLMLSLAAITIGLTGVVAARALLWSLPSKFLTGLAASSGIAFINSVGTTGGFVGPYMMGVLKDATGSFQTGVAALAGIMMFSGACALWLRRYVKD